VLPGVRPEEVDGEMTDPTGRSGRHQRHGPTEEPAVYRRNRRLTATSLFALAALVPLLAAATYTLFAPMYGPEDTMTVGADLGWLDVSARIVVPRSFVVIGAMASWLAVVAGIAALQTAYASRILASHPRRLPPLQPDLPIAHELAEPPVLPSAAGFDARVDRLFVTVLIPAHNEATTIGATLDSLQEQERRPDRVIVVADNCSDDTVAIARGRDAEVFVTVDNESKKAGALNQALATLLPTAQVRDVVLVMDADTVLVTPFIAVAEQRLLDDPELQAVGGVFYGEKGPGLVGVLQRNEYTRYGRDIARKRGRVMVLTGTGTMFKTVALRAVADSRGLLVPGAPGAVYDTDALTEDNELTLALKTLGAKLVSPKQCVTITEVMPSWRHLWRQRDRWQRGALENLGAYGLTLTTAKYWWQQFAIAYGTFALNAYLLLMVILFTATGRLVWAPFWLAVGSIFVVERLVTVWAAGWRGRLVAAPLVIEIAYDLFIQAVFVKGCVDIMLGRKAHWGHVDRAALGPAQLDSSIGRQVSALSPAAWAVVPLGAAGGALLPYEVLDSPFVEALAVVVALNTLMYATLSIGKLLPRRTA